ncbi:inhibin beta chain isoform X1 [Drosophila santomea]|uniref:inhibin beta chain isoform X1 n=1 Tax=Drosophila santomea TaxID=129105 RepID=UPI001952F211|nr:inhibin beta chain isoform X1 [Drosophila santomea]XP_039496413.1 inhibin beta chain isoform X1 [Drosophila santomea]
MRFAFDSNYSQSEAPIKGNKCFFNCQCICCRQGCCVVVVKCCCCYSLNCCNSLGSRKSFPQPAVMRKKVSDTEVLSVSKLVAVILVLARWVTALATLLTSCILLDIFSLPGQSGVADRSQASSRTVHVSVPTTPNGTPSSTSEAKLKLFYGYTSYDINNDQQVKSNNLCRVLCRSRNRKRQRRRRRRRRHRRRRHIYTKHHQMQRKQQKYLRTDHLMQSNVSNFEQRLNFNDGKCHSLETNYGTNYDLVHRGKPFGQSERSFLMSPLREIEAPWPSSQGSVRNCSKIKRNRANLIWLLIGLVWFEVKLINCNGISSSNYYASNLETHKGCTLCHDSGKPNIYTDKDNPHTDYNIYNKYHNNNFNKKTNQPHNNIAPSDEVRLESIKRQILTKLGLSHRPNVSHPLPKQFIWETIYRADGGRMIPNNAFESSGKDLDQKTLKPRALASSGTHMFSGQGGRTYLSSERDPSHHQYRSPFDFTFNISKDNLYGRVLRNRSLDRRHITKIDKNHLFFKGWTEKRQLKINSRIASKPTEQLKSHYNSSTKKLKSGALRKINGINSKQMNENALKKSTYLIDINHSSENSTGINGEIRANAYEYLNDYSVQTHNKNRYYEGSSSIGHQSPIRSSKDENQKGNQESIAHGQENIDHEDFFGNTQEIITFAEEGTQYRQYRILEFSVQNRRVPTQKLSIRSAQIHIRIDKPHSFWIERAKSLPEEQWLNTKKKWGAKKPHHRIKIWVFQLSTSINITEMGIEKAIIFRASFDVDTKNLGWQKFDLTDTIRDWYSHTSHEKLRLLIDCTGCAGRYSLHLFQTSKLRGNSSDYLSTNPNRPFLVLHTESSRTRRVRRRAIDCGGALNGQCCKESFYVSFKALGWDDWIIAPRGYFANYCRGDCTGSFRTPDTFQTFHAHFIEEYRKMGLLNGMRPCCAPIKFSSMSLIYYGDDGIIKRDLPKMVVDECGCP